MVEIEFSYVEDHPNDRRIWTTFIDEFCAQHGVKVHIREEMDWETGWTKLFAHTSHSTAPHVSHIGSTWIDSLARLKVLRPFKQDEIEEIGGSWDFTMPNWEAGILADSKQIWAIPWTSWIYVICYRKDLLQQVGIDPTDAFSTIKNTSQTVQKLTASSLEIPWLNAQLAASYRDFLHVAASWVWAAGGDFTDKDGKAITFNSPQAIQGLKHWLSIYCAVAHNHKSLSQDETFKLFREGRAAAILANIYGANIFIGAESTAIVRENIGVASVTDTPWTGGGNLVIWQHVQHDPQQEKAAVALVKFLARKEINIRYQHQTASMPARIDALKEIYPAGNPIRETVMHTASKGRHYYNTPVWRRVEQQLSETLGVIVNEMLHNPTINTDVLLHQHLDMLARQLNAIMYT